MTEVSIYQVGDKGKSRSRDDRLLADRRPPRGASGWARATARRMERPVGAKSRQCCSSRRRRPLELLLIRHRRLLRLLLLRQRHSILLQLLRHRCALLPSFSADVHHNPAPHQCLIWIENGLAELDSCVKRRRRRAGAHGSKLGSF